jgi:protein-L-isoaspartate(D-aspartate) O-methyltransferase
VDYAAARSNMVDSQLRTNKVTDRQVIDAFKTVPRELFVPEHLRGIAYVDDDLPIGGGRSLMEPMVFARLLQAAEIEPTDIVLDIGCGSGYSTAVLAHLAGTVVGLESDPALAAKASDLLARQEVDNAVVVGGDLRGGYSTQAPYNVIVLAGAVAELPGALTDQLAESGRLVTVRLDDSGLGRAIMARRDGGVISERILFDASTPVLLGFERKPSFAF